MMMVASLGPQTGRAFCMFSSEHLVRDNSQTMIQVARGYTDVKRQSPFFVFKRICSCGASERKTRVSLGLAKFP